MKTQIDIPKKRHHATITNVAFFGSADVDESHPAYQEAFKVARHLAYNNKVIINGGGPGIMDAATKGAQAGAGKTIGVTFYPQDMPEFEGRFHENNVDVEIKTANYVERMFNLMQYSDAFICFEGGTGTLSEWATAWLLAHLYYGHHKPIVLYGAFWKEVMAVIDKHFFIGEKEHLVYKIVTDVEGVVDALAEFEKDLHDRCGLPHHTNAETNEKVEGDLLEASKYAL